MEQNRHVYNYQVWTLQSCTTGLKRQDSVSNSD